MGNWASFDKEILKLMLSRRVLKLGEERKKYLIHIKLLLIELGLLFVLQPSETPIPNIEEEIQVLTFYHLMEVVPKELWKQSF